MNKAHKPVPITDAFVILTYVSILIYRVIDLYNRNNIRLEIIVIFANKSIEYKFNDVAPVNS